MTTPHGWFVGGRAPQDYEFGSDGSHFHSGQRAAVIRSQVARPADFGTLMQACRADDYRGKRLRLGAWMKVEKVEGWCGLWLRVDQEHLMLAFDNMEARPVRGTSDWTEHAVVLDVPTHATALSYGVLLHGLGTVWFDDLSFTIVGDDVPVTGARDLPRGPVNLDFEDAP